MGKRTIVSVGGTVGQSVGLREGDTDCSIVGEIVGSVVRVREGAADRSGVGNIEGLKD